MRCVSCENDKPLKREVIKIKYVDCGLDNVVLDGVEFHRCPSCGETYYGFGNIEQLHGVIAQALITQRTLLSFREIRFLRTLLGYSGAMFAKRLGLAPETVSRYETGAQKIPLLYDTLVRALVATKYPDRSYDLHDQILEKRSATLKRIEIEPKKEGWGLKGAQG